MKTSAIIANCVLFFCGLSIALGASNTIPAIPHRQAAQETFASPRLAALQKELSTGNRAALESFWQEVAKQGAPLVEPIAGENPEQRTPRVDLHSAGIQTGGKALSPTHTL